MLIAQRNTVSNSTPELSQLPQLWPDMLVVSCPRPGFVFCVPRFVLRVAIFGHLMVGVRRNGENRGTVPLLLLPLNPGSFLATVLISEAANMSHCLSIRVVLNSGHESWVKFEVRVLVPTVPVARRTGPGQGPFVQIQTGISNAVILSAGLCSTQFFLDWLDSFDSFDNPDYSTLTQLIWARVEPKVLTQNLLMIFIVYSM